MGRTSTAPERALMKLALTVVVRLVMRPVVRALLLAAVLLNFGACGSLLPKPTPQPAFFALQAAVSVVRPAPVTATPSPNPVALARVASTVPVVVLVVQAAKAAPGFDSSRIIYTRQPQRLEYYARSEWIDARLKAIDLEGQRALVAARLHYAYGENK